MKNVLTLNSVSRRFSGENLKVRSAIPHYWYNDLYGGNSWTSLLSMKLIVSRIVGPDPAVADHLAYARVMLAEELCCDATIVAKNGAEVNYHCHRSILAAHSDVFRTMFQVNMKEAQTGKVEMDMAEVSVRALLDYLYLWEIKAPQESSLVCFELREAGHKNSIDDLEKATEKILLRKDAPWYDAEVALRLLFTRGLELEALKVKAVKVMKSKVGELKDLPAYKKLFKKNVDIAIEISQCFATIQ